MHFKRSKKEATKENFVLSVTWLCILVTKKIHTYISLKQDDLAVGTETMVYKREYLLVSYNYSLATRWH